MNLGCRQLIAAILVPYVVATLIGPFFVLCIESDGSLHFEPVFEACCGSEHPDPHADHGNPSDSPATLSQGDPCADCTDFALDAPALAPKVRPEPVAAAAGIWSPGWLPALPVTLSDLWPGHPPRATAASDFARRPHPPRSGIRVLLI